MEITLVLAAAFVTALATGLGAVPFAFAGPGGISAQRIALGNASAAGLMLAAAGMLALEGVRLGPLAALLGGTGGVLFIRLSDAILSRFEHLDIGALSGADAKRALLIVGIMTLHSAAEGIGVGVAFGDGAPLGWFVTIAMAIHNIPEGLAISLVLVPRGVSWRAAAGWSVFSSLPQPLLAVPAYLSVRMFEPVLPAGLGFAAGAMAWMALADMLPEATAGAPLWRVLAVLAASVAVMLGVFALLPGG
ncbi:ZIP family metal transporter [Elioraea sp.]|uniref:ZIP family metal transporter n=1 Tax=Elioraea sp. TaxID=2185103 RepID=UPI0025C05B24|nr:ZIP family metal transporter [Elioraea sp.]